MTAEDDLVRIATLHDHVEAEMLLALFETNAIPGAIPGLEFRARNGGMLAAYVDLPVMVPASRAEEARELLHALREGVPVDDDGEPLVRGGGPVDGAVDGAGPYRTGAGEPAPARVESPRLRRIAGFVAFAVTFGAAHFYARETWAGLVLALAQLGAVVAMLNGEAGGAVALVVIVLADFAGGVRACGRAQRGRRRSAGRQLLGAGVAAAVAVLVGFVGVPRVAAWQAERALAREPHHPLGGTTPGGYLRSDGSLPIPLEFGPGAQGAGRGEAPGPPR